MISRPARTSSRTSRFAAIETLYRLERSRSPVKPIFDAVAEECSLPGPERALAMKLIYGILRQREYLELLLARLCSRPAARLDPLVYWALAVGLYQLFCLDRIPESAAVNETVNALKAAGLKKHLHGFVNGVLRAATRQRGSLPGPEMTLPSGRPLLNHPEWLTARWASRFGQEEMERICLANNREPQLVLRVNSPRCDRLQLADRFHRTGIAAHHGRYAPDSLILPEYQGSVTSLPGFEEGCFQVQDEAAQLAVLLLGPFMQEGKYLDACAGLGGKTSHLLQLVTPGSRVVAVEPEPGRRLLLEENLGRLFPDYSLSISPSSLQEYCRESDLRFDGVLVDAPCSGTGVTGRHPDIRWNRSSEDPARYQLTQLDILEHAADRVAPAGILVYATCSLESEENEEVIQQFLKRHQDFSSTDCSRYLPESAGIFVKGNFFCPHPTGSIDGFFAARLQRKK